MWMFSPLAKFLERNFKMPFSLWVINNRIFAIGNCVVYFHYTTWGFIEFPLGAHQVNLHSRLSQGCDYASSVTRWGSGEGTRGVRCSIWPLRSYLQRYYTPGTFLCPLKCNLCSKITIWAWAAVGVNVLKALLYSYFVTVIYISLQWNIRELFSCETT